MVIIPNYVTPCTGSIFIIIKRWVEQCHKPPMTGNGLFTTYPIHIWCFGGWLIIVLPTLYRFMGLYSDYSTMFISLSTMIFTYYLDHRMGLLGPVSRGLVILFQ
jgi:hypothetical protein